jgi:hypothetical protein
MATRLEQVLARAAELPAPEQGLLAFGPLAFWRSDEYPRALSKLTLGVPQGEPVLVCEVVVKLALAEPVAHNPNIEI